MVTPLRVTPATRDAVLRQAAQVLSAGGVVVIPTDTVYGLAALPACAASVARLGSIKGRATGKPIALLAADADAFRRSGATFPPAAACLAERFWPGALTLVLDCGGAAEGFRVPDHSFCRSLLAACGGLLRVTSANLSGTQPALSAAQALADIGLDADLVIDDGPSPGGVASSVVRVSADAVTILREGAIPTALLKDPESGISSLPSVFLRCGD